MSPPGDIGVRLRPTMLSDLDFVISVEEDPRFRPLKWTATADSILEKLHRLRSRISGAGR